jgi:hypothetical protein
MQISSHCQEYKDTDRNVLPSGSQISLAVLEEAENELLDFDTKIIHLGICPEHLLQISVKMFIYYYLQ